jgi:hypothetical protein
MLRLQRIEKKPMTETIDAFIFYFDLIGVREQFLAAQQETLARMRAFQAKSRAAFPLFGPHSTIKTLADNVWARVNADEESADVLTIELATRTMKAACEFGFDNYFGVITRGEHVFDLIDRTLFAGADPTDIQIQHIDMTSEPHMRAAFAEKWSAHLARNNALPVPAPCVWISEETFPESGIDAALCGIDLPCTIGMKTFDLATLPGPSGKRWPFKQSRFRAITTR